MKIGVRAFLPLLIATALVAFLFVKPVFAKSGCCSWHGGVCGCDTSVGRQVCCDGTYSPSCTCAYVLPTTPAFTPIPKPTTTPTPRSTATPIPSPSSTDTPTLEPTQEPILTPEVKEASDSEGEDASLAGAFGILVAIGVLGWGGYKLAKKLVSKRLVKS